MSRRMNGHASQIGPAAAVYVLGLTCVSRIAAARLAPYPDTSDTEGATHMSFEAAVHAKAIELGKLSVEMTTAAGSGHPSSSLSLAHLVTVLMYQHMRWEPKTPWHPASDRLVLSEGHA